ncbi:hypothetical protein Tco_1344507 [Tanacetum coccineum]
MPIELGSFDAIIGMDWLVKYQAIIVCAEKIIRIPWGNETLIVHGDGSNRGHEARLHIISYTKTQEYMLKGCPIFLAHVTTKGTEDKSKEKRLEDVPIVRDFPDVFPEDLPGLPLTIPPQKSVMSSDSAVTYTFVHSEARSWSIPSEDPYEEAARQLLEQAPRPSEYVPDPIELEDHVPVYIPG